MDCSGFSAWVFHQVGIDIGPGTWFQRDYCQKHGQQVTSYQAGDLLFWMNEGPETPSHVGIATGEGTVIEETATYGNVVEVAVSPRWATPWIEAFRIL